MTQKGEYDLSSGSPWLTMHSHLFLLFQINITVTLLQKEKTHKKNTSHIGANLQIDKTETVFCF